MVTYDISESALTNIVSLALEDLPNIRLAQSSSRSVGDVLSGKRPKPVRVDRHGDSLLVDVMVNIDYGKSAHELAAGVQRSVSEAVAASTGLKVHSVNVAVVSVDVRD
jgi:uncharacterized alkaline shock family protein YloU